MRNLLILLGLALSLGTTVLAQDVAETATESTELWTRGAGIGLDFSQLLQLNPKQGAGENRIGIGGTLNYFANYKKDKIAWDNKFSLNLGAQRLGSGTLININGQEDSKPFIKTIDEMRINSKVGYKTSDNSKFFYAADFSFLSQFLPTYTDGEGNNNLVREPLNGNIVSKLFSPAVITLSVGMDYKPSDKFSIYYSPVAYKGIYVLDDEIASREGLDENGEGIGLSVFGNEWNSPTDFRNTFHQFGSLLRFAYNDKIWKDKITWSSNLALFSNYLNNPQNIDVDWTNEFSLTIYEGLQLSLLANVFYDHDILVQVSDRDAVGGVSGLGRRVSYTQQLLIKYVHQF